MTTREALASDFRSDTVTYPSDDMKAFMMQAELGDDVFGEDPTVLQLQERVAGLTGKESALFVPTGCMGNLIALMTLASPGQVLYSGSHSHIKLYELGSYAQLAGLSLRETDDSQGYLDRAQLASNWSPEIYYIPQPGLVAVENSHNMLGGLIYPPEELEKLRAFTQEKCVPLHMDGARLFNASVAANKPITTWTNLVDSVMISLSKGLGAPAGSVLAGGSDLIKKALRVRKLLGGGMRQTGILAAAGLYALDHNIPLLKRDHTLCTLVYNGVKDSEILTPVKPQTNILMLDFHQPVASQFAEYMERQNLRLMAISHTRVRIVFHQNISDDACDRLVETTRKWRPAH